MKLPHTFVVDDEASGLVAFLTIDSLHDGVAFGGVRRATYASLDLARDDSMRLARAMSDKLALAELPAGGAKTVIADHPRLDRMAAYRRLGNAIEALAGRYVCGPDVGTGDRELAALRERTVYVNPEGNDAGRATADGVMAALRATCLHCFGSREVNGRSFAIEGLGSVGFALARTLLADGAQEVVGYDVSSSACESARALGVAIEPDGDALWCRNSDVLVPCALGGGLTERRAAAVGARAICGSANNQLVDDAVAEQLHARGVVWVPDVLASAGAVVEGVITVRHGRTPAAIDDVAARIRSIERRVTAVLEDAVSQRISPQRLVRRTLETLRESTSPIR